MFSRFGGEAVPTRGQPCLSLLRRSAAVPLFLCCGESEALWSLHVRGQQKERVRGCGQGRLLKPILGPDQAGSGWGTRHPATAKAEADPPPPAKDDNFWGGKDDNFGMWEGRQFGGGFSRGAKRW